METLTFVVCLFHIVSTKVLFNMETLTFAIYVSFTQSLPNFV